MLNKNFILLALCVFCFATAIPSIADHLKAEERSDLADGGIVISKSFKTNRFVYKSIGGNTTVKGKEKKRKWWCAWLCTRRTEKKAERITIQNTYFAKSLTGVFTNQQGTPLECLDSASCTQKEWEVGVLPSITFPGEIGEVEIVGVQSRHTVQVDNAFFSAVTEKGEVPDADASNVE